MLNFCRTANNYYFCIMSSHQKKPILYIIAGPNGAGKTTASMNILPDLLECKEFVNADEIAKGLSPFKPEEMATQAGKLMLERINSLLSQRVSFAIETTLATRSYLKLVEQAQSLGYTVQLLFFWLESPEMACQRVEKRVSEGGHDIPVETVHRRYRLGLDNLFNIFIPNVDYWSIYDNNFETKLIADSNNIEDLIKFEEIKKSCQTKKL